jgi:peroxiredoxin
LGQLQEAYPRLQELGYRLIAMSPDNPTEAATLARDLGLAFPVVSDEGLVLTRRFGIAFQAPDRDTLPVPAVYFISGDGTIELHYVHPNHRIRLDTELLLAAARIGHQDEGK